MSEYLESGVFVLQEHEQMKPFERHSYTNTKKNLCKIVCCEVIKYTHELFGAVDYESILTHRKSRVAT